MNLLEATDVSVSLGGRQVLQDVSLAVKSGEIVGLIGPNGAGKTTLLRAMLGLVPAATGHSALRAGAGYVPQRHEFAWDYPITVGNAALSALTRRTQWWRGYTRQQRAAVAGALSQVDLTPLRDRPVGQLSGGQRQRVLVARALALEPGVLLLDEPFTGLDVPTQELLTALLRDLMAQGKAVLMTTHDLNIAAQLCTRICLLNGIVVADGDPSLLDDTGVWLKAFGIRR
ncbi:anchored repeat-type ABC transporter ATP-binding subunit [Catelliglobosispora koreensis]|uniref:anchored repeat-type ABC transporter ATP-binding subunit n=1 Tax=Catelliglobosispora koreensis TaxID=129052 RepID=UPI00058B87A1|nr:anchored repeat-type ABC transporter ATP-binding subunit [Catelliglobosispora koreensis]